MYKVSEKRPKIDKQVLVLSAGKSEWRVARWTAEGVWLEGIHKYADHTVTHWTELPKKPELEEVKATVMLAPRYTSCNFRMV